MSFNPSEHIIKLKGKDYLEVKWRLCWFRDEHPVGTITTEVIELNPVIVRAVITSNDGVVLASGLGSAQSKGNQVWSGREIEKAETAAIGRALAHAGYGTQFTGEDESDNVVDSPIDRNTSQPPQNAPTGSKSKSQKQTPNKPVESPENEPQGESDHWIANTETQAEFWSWCDRKGLSKPQVHEILSVDSMYKFTGHEGQAKTAIMNYLTERARG